MQGCSVIRQTARSLVRLLDCMHEMSTLLMLLKYHYLHYYFKSQYKVLGFLIPVVLGVKFS